MNTQRIMAIFEKDIKDFMKNTMTLFTPVMPILLAVMYSRMTSGSEELSYIVYIIIGITLSTVATGLMMMMMAEENEKDTLRGLIISPTSFVDIIVGKSLVVTVLTVITYVASLAILDVSFLFNGKVILTSLLLFIFFLFLGIGIGLFVKSVGATTVYMLPIMLVFGFTPLFQMINLEENHLIIKIVDYFPLMAAIDYNFNSSWQSIVVIIGWIIVAGIFMYICFARTAKNH